MPIKYDNNKLRQPGLNLEITPEQMSEIVKCSKDVKYFAGNYYKVIHPKKGEMIMSLYEYQREMLDHFQTNMSSITCSARQMGKLHPLDTPILTPFGYVSFGDLKVGDLVYDEHGKAVEVTYITDIETTGKMYEVHFDNQDIIKAGSEHLWKVNHKRGHRQQTEVMTTEEMVGLHNQLQKRKNPENISIDMIDNPIEFSSQKVPIDPYLLGLWLGDGNSNGGWITCQKDDYEFYKKTIKNNIVNELKIDPRKGNCGRFKIEELTTALRNANLYKNKHIPKEYLFNNVEVRLEVLRGLMDTDGHIEPNGKCRFYQSNEKFAYSVRDLLSSLGIKSTIRIRKTYRKDNYTVSFMTNKFEVCKLPRKLANQKGCLGHPKNSRVYITQFKEIPFEPARCIQVNNPSHLYAVGKTCIPTHNTTCSSLYLLWYAIFNEKKTLAILANKQDTAASTIDDIKKAYEGLPLWLKPGVTVYNNLSIEFENGTRIFARATSENALRGESVSVLFLDEFAFIDNNLMEKFWPSNYPTIAANKGQIIIVSTPNGAAGKFYELYNEALNHDNNKSPFRAVTFPWTLHPDKDEQWKQDMLATMTEVQFRQEFECSFAGSTYTLINGDTLSALKRLNPIEIRDGGSYLIWEKPKRGHVYAIGTDTAAGNGNDFSIAAIYDITNFFSKTSKYHQVGLYRCNDKNIFDFSKIVFKLGHEWNHAVIINENNESGLGNILAQQLYNELAYERIYFDFKLSRVGVNSNTQTKKLATTYFKQDLEKGVLDTNCGILIDELLIYEEKEARPGLFSAKRGRNYHDDVVSGSFWVSFLLRTDWFDSMREEIYARAAAGVVDKMTQAQIAEEQAKEAEEQYDLGLADIFMKKGFTRNNFINNFEDEMWSDD